MEIGEATVRCHDLQTARPRYRLYRQAETFSLPVMDSATITAEWPVENHRKKWECETDIRKESENWKLGSFCSGIKVDSISLIYSHIIFHDIVCI